MDNQPIRVLHVIGQMNYGGAETLIMSLYRNIDRSRVQFDFVESACKEAAFDSEIRSLGGRVYHCPHYNAMNHQTYVHWWKEFFRSHGSEYAVVHGHIGSTAAIYLHEAKKHGLITIAHSHNTNGVGLNGLVYRAFAFPTRFIADQFFTCSRSAGIDRYGKKVGSDPERCILLRNAIETRRFSYDAQLRKATRAEWNISDDEFVVGHVGRFVQQKNHMFLLDIFAELVKREPRSRLLLIGQEDNGGKIRQKAEALGLTERVIFAGTHRDTAPFYQAMDVFLLPSLFEGLGIVNIEAQTSGLLSFTSDKVVAPECKVTELMHFIPLNHSPEQWAEEILQTYSERSPRRDHSEEVRAAGFDVSETAEWLCNFYRKALSERG